MHTARHFRARPHHRRQERARELEGDAADLDWRRCVFAYISSTRSRGPGECSAFTLRFSPRPRTW
jgi:hypothetical protein